MSRLARHRRKAFHYTESGVLPDSAFLETTAILPAELCIITREDPGLRGESQAGISSRQAQVLRLIAWGYTSKEIAAQLSISVKTVESHKAAAMRKLDMNSRVEIVRYALREGWFEEV